MGGLSFHVRVPDWTARVERERRDIDLATLSSDRKALSGLMEASGYVADRQYNALYGHKQMYFMDPARGRPVDVIVDRLDMCHTFEFTDRLGVDRPTVPLAAGGAVTSGARSAVGTNSKAPRSSYERGPTPESTVAGSFCRL